MAAGPGEGGGDPPELHRRAEERPPERVAVGVVERGAAAALEAEGREALARHGEVAGEHPSEPDLAILGDQALEAPPGTGRPAWMSRVKSTCQA